MFVPSIFFKLFISSNHIVLILLLLPSKLGKPRPLLPITLRGVRTLLVFRIGLAGGGLGLLNAGGLCGAPNLASLI